MSKIITAAQAAELVQDGCTLTTTGFNGFGCPEDLMMALADHFDQTSHPKDVTLVKVISQGHHQIFGASEAIEARGGQGAAVLDQLGGLGGGDDLAHVCSLSLFRSSSMLLLYHAFSLGQDSNCPFSPFFGAEKRISCAFSCVPVY